MSRSRKIWIIEIRHYSGISQPINRDTRGANAPDESKKPQENQSPSGANAPNAPASLTGAEAAQAAAKTANQEARNQERVEIAKQRTVGIELNAKELGRFSVLYADPPWQYENPPMGGSNRSIENHYPTMTLEEICALPIGDIAYDNSILFLDGFRA
jgi:hypothetical protein